MSKPWKWLEEIEEISKCTISKRRGYWRDIQACKLSTPNQDIKQLIACIKEMREALEFYYKKEKYELKSTITFLNGSSITFPEPSDKATQTLTRCAEGDFK